MTAHERSEHDLPQRLTLLAEGPRPDYRDSLVEATARTPQRPAWTFPGRWLPMDITAQRVMPAPAIRVSLALLLLAALVGAALVGLAVASRPDLPAPFGPAANGRIVYSSDGDLFVIDPRAAAPRSLIGGTTDDHSPLFSPRGDVLRFIRSTSLGDQVWLSDSDGANARPLTAPLTGLATAAWAPNGSSLAVAWSDHGYPRVAIVPTDGSGMREIDLGMPADSPDWRPASGDQLVVRGQHDGTYDLYLVDAASLRSSRMALGDTDGPVDDFEKYLPNWSPDGSQLIYQRHEDVRGASGGPAIRIHLVDVDAAGSVVRDTRLQHDRSADFEYFGRWLTDGRFAFAAQTGCTFEVFVGRLPGIANATRIATIDDCANEGIDYVLSPDAAEVLYWGAGGVTTPGVWRTEVTGGSGTALLPDALTLGQVTWQRAP